MGVQLKTTTEYVLNHPATHDNEWMLSNVLKYASFMKQKPELWMFVPCDEDGNVLEEPENIPAKLGLGLDHFSKKEIDEMDTYLEAYSRVIFEGFSYKDGVLFYNKPYKRDLLRFEDGRLKYKNNGYMYYLNTIEEGVLNNLNPEVTQSKAKELGLI